MDAEEAVNVCDEILEVLEDEEFPSAGEDFAVSVGEKVADIKVFAEENGYVTDRQAEALENMLAGARRWLHR